MHYPHLQPGHVWNDVEAELRRSLIFANVTPSQKDILQSHVDACLVGLQRRFGVLATQQGSLAALRRLREEAMPVEEARLVNAANQLSISQSTLRPAFECSRQVLSKCYGTLSKRHDAAAVKEGKMPLATRTPHAELLTFIG